MCKQCHSVLIMCILLKEEDSIRFLKFNFVNKSKNPNNEWVKF